MHLTMKPLNKMTGTNQTVATSTPSGSEKSKDRHQKLVALVEGFRAAAAEILQSATESQTAASAQEPAAHSLPSMHFVHVHKVVEVSAFEFETLLKDRAPKTGKIVFSMAEFDEMLGSGARIEGVFQEQRDSPSDDDIWCPCQILDIADDELVELLEARKKLEPFLSSASEVFSHGR